MRAHSQTLKTALSPEINNEIAKWYNLPWTFDRADTMDLKSVIEELRKPDRMGLLVTLPHKLTVIPMLDEVDSSVIAIGACNVIGKRDDGRLVGTNTDHAGVYNTLRLHSTEGQGKPAAVV